MKMISISKGGFKIFKRNTKGQAALEFLTTYGWAFLVILIMISALAYFGILNPSKLLPERCTFGTEIECVDYVLDLGNTDLRLKLKNNVGETITVSQINISVDGNDIGCEESSPSALSNWGSGKIVDYTESDCAFTGTGFVAGDKGKVDVLLTYYSVKSGSTYSHDIHGEIYATLK